MDCERLHKWEFTMEKSSAPHQRPAIRLSLKLHTKTWSEVKCAFTWVKVARKIIAIKLWGLTFSALPPSPTRVFAILKVTRTDGRAASMWQWRVGKGCISMNQMWNILTTKDHSILSKTRECVHWTKLDHHYCIQKQRLPDCRVGEPSPGRARKMSSYQACLFVIPVSKPFCELLQSLRV